MKDEKFLSSRQKDVIERAREHPNNNSFSNIMATARCFMSPVVQGVFKKWIWE